MAKADDKVKNDAFNAFAYALVYDKKLRDAYFDSLKKQGYNAIVDDADVGRGVDSDSPLIIFDRQRTLSRPEITKLKKQR